jgi:hypothetical protein
MNGGTTITIGKHTIPLLVHNDEAVTTFRRIEMCHERPPGTAKRTFREHKHRFTEGKHYYNLTYDQVCEMYTRCVPGWTPNDCEDEDADDVVLYP